MSIFRISAIFAAVSVLASCQTQPGNGLSTFGKRYDYVSFKPPRNADGVGAIIDFKASSESLVARPTECVLSAQGGVQSTRSKAAIGKVDWKIDKSTDNKASVPKSLLEFANVEAVFNLTRVQTAEIELLNPFEDKISRISVQSAQDELRRLESPCTPLFTDNKNLLIHSVLGGAGLNVVFRDNQGRTINLSAEAIDDITASSKNTSVLDSGETIAYSGEIFVGYRAWEITKAAGNLGAPLQFRELSTLELEGKEAAFATR